MSVAGSLVKCAIRRAAFGIDGDTAIAEAEYKHEVFCLYDYDISRVYGYDEQIGYVSVHDRRTYRGYEECLRAFAMTLDQYRTHYALYSERSPIYVKDS